ncbi:hypothetical protein [Actinomyces oricola]
MTVIGGAGLILCLILFFVTESMGSINEDHYVNVPSNGESTNLTLLEDTTYGFYSDDKYISCTVRSPADSKVSVQRSPRASAKTPPEQLVFTSTFAGTYKVACTSAHPVRINLSDTASGRETARLLFFFSMPLMPINAGVLIAGSVWLLVRRRKRARILVSQLANHQAPGPGAPMGGQAAAVPWTGAHQQFSYPGALSAASGPTPSGPIPVQPVAPGTLGQTVPSAPGAQSGSYAQSAQSGSYAQSAQSGPVAQSAQSGPVPPSAQSASSGGYGIAPQQVVYRPMPPPAGGARGD